MVLNVICLSALSPTSRECRLDRLQANMAVIDYATPVQTLEEGWKFCTGVGLLATTSICSGFDEAVRRMNIMNQTNSAITCETLPTWQFRLVGPNYARVETKCSNKDWIAIWQDIAASWRWRIDNENKQVHRNLPWALGPGEEYKQPSRMEIRILEWEGMLSLGQLGYFPITSYF